MTSSLSRLVSPAPDLLSRFNPAPAVINRQRPPKCSSTEIDAQIEDLRMFGLFKKKVTPGEFGQAVSYLAKDPLSADAGRSLGARFDDYDASGGWPKFLERRGVPIPTQMLYHWLF